MHCTLIKLMNNTYLIIYFINFTFNRGWGFEQNRWILLSKTILKCRKPQNKCIIIIVLLIF